MALALLALFFVQGCAGGGRDLAVKDRGGEGPLQEAPDPARQYAGEILAYLLRVAVGKEGRTDQRKEWATVGMDQPLNLENVYDCLTNPQRNVQDVLPLDANVLDLSQVLYTYDPDLSFSKGRFGLINVYPAAEFLAIRLLLLQKMNRKEKIHLQALLERKALLFDAKNEPSGEDLRETNLRPDEMALVRAVLQKMPSLYRYLTNPFLVKALYDVGAVEGDPFVLEKAAAANYRPYCCQTTPDDEGQARVAILTSMVRDFYYNGKEECEPYGFLPTQELKETIHKLQRDILSKAKERVRREIESGDEPKRPLSDEQWDRLWATNFEGRISFCAQDRRPFVVYPGNAQQVIADVSPKADYAVVLLGKQVYLALLIEPKDIYPFVNVSYVDVTDVTYSQAEEECSQAAEAICSKLKGPISRAKASLQSARTESPAQARTAERPCRRGPQRLSLARPHFP